MDNLRRSERREFLAGVASLSLLGLAGCGSGGGGSNGTTPMMTGGNTGGIGTTTGTAVGGMPLRTPAMMSGNTLSAATGAYDLGPGPQAGAMLFNAQWPSPMIRIAPGMSLDVTLRNQLSEPTNVHWHGLVAAPGMDGHPTEVVAPGGSKRYTFSVDERPGTYWYHPHPDRATARQAYSGLAGMLIVDDGNDAARGMPTGSRDLSLVLADKRMSNGVMIYQPGILDVMTGWLGNVMTVNGAYCPATVTVEPAIIRLRLLSASNARILSPALASGRSFWLAATDGGLLAAPILVNSLLLAPGERAEILLDLRSDAGQAVKLVSSTYTTMGASMNGMAPMQGAAFDLLSMTVAGTAATSPGSVPTAFAPIVRFDPAEPAINRVFELTELGGMMSAMHRINNLVYDGARIDFVARRGDLERWQFINRGMEPHPMHVHGTQFQVVSRDGIATRRVATDMGWKDTVLVRPLETVEIALRFRNAGNYVLHCHNLEHEDDGMMMNFNVV
jgi:FtsP/CotA-like multicopper oxidase with cupredoxin domain